MRPYTDEKLSTSIFMAMLTAVNCRGWIRASPTDTSELDKTPIISFRPHEMPNEFEEFFSKALSSYNGVTSWLLEHTANNGFILYQTDIASYAKEHGASIAEAREFFQKMRPELGRQANDDLINLADAMYAAAQKEDGTSEE